MAVVMTSYMQFYQIINMYITTSRVDVQHSQLTTLYSLFKFKFKKKRCFESISYCLFHMSNRVNRNLTTFFDFNKVPGIYIDKVYFLISCSIRKWAKK